MIDTNHQKKFEEIWDNGNYRLGSTAQRLVGRILEVVPEGAVLNDYGSGTGRAEVEIIKQRPTQVINMVDIAPNALEKDCRELLNRPGSTLTYSIADLSDLGSFPHAGYGICINVLMTVQPDKLDAILSEIRRTCDVFMFEAYDFPDVRLGHQMTTVQKNKTEWEEKLRQFWGSVTFEKSPESVRRYIYICKEGK